MHNFDLKTPADLTNMLRSVPGNSAMLELQRDDKTLRVSVPIQKWPSMLDEQFVHVSGAVIGTFARMGDAESNPEKLLVVHNVKDSSAADVAGLQDYDLIKSVDGKLLNTPKALADYLTDNDGRRVVINVRREEYAYRQTYGYKLIELDIENVQKIAR